MKWKRVNDDNKFKKSLMEPAVVQGVAPSFARNSPNSSGSLGKRLAACSNRIMIRPLPHHDEHDAAEISRSSRLPTR